MKKNYDMSSSGRVRNILDTDRLNAGVKMKEVLKADIKGVLSNYMMIDDRRILLTVTMTPAGEYDVIISVRTPMLYELSNIE